MQQRSSILAVNTTSIMCFLSAFTDISYQTGSHDINHILQNPHRNKKIRQQFTVCNFVWIFICPTFIFVEFQCRFSKIHIIITTGLQARDFYEVIVS